MNCFRLLSLAALVWLSVGAARADKIAMPKAPPKEKALTGTLAWENVKRRDGTTYKGRLVLKTKDRQIAMPMISKEKIKATTGKSFDAAKFAGKRVKVTARVIEYPKRRGRPQHLRVVSVTRIERAATSVAAKPTKPKPTQR